MTEHRPPWPADKPPKERGLFQGYEQFATHEAVWIAFREKYGYDPQHLVATGGGWLAGPNTGGEIMKWLRWKLALLLDKYPDTCWADLVIWTIYPDIHPFSEIFEMRGTAGQCERAGCTPYCGKCAKREEP